MAALRSELAALMHEKAGMSRDADGLGAAQERIRAMRDEAAQLGAGVGTRDYNFGLVQYLELGWLLDVSETIVASALARTESRGVHVRTDYPNQDDAQADRDFGYSRGRRPGYAQGSRRGFLTAKLPAPGRQGRQTGGGT